MAASDHLNPQQFFHGSRAQLGVGDYITPGHSPKWQASKPDQVYFTPSHDVAYGFAHGTALNSDPNKYQGPAHIYTVEPTGKYTKDAGYEGRKSNPLDRAYQSRAPLRVTGEVPLHGSAD